MQANPDQMNAMTNPNQASFPLVLQFRLPNEVLNADEMRADEDLQSENRVIVDVVLMDAPIPGEFFESPSKLYHAEFFKVISSRESKGVWDGPTWQGAKPLWYRCLCILEKNKPKDV